MRTGIPVRILRIDENQEKELKRDIWSRSYVPVQIELGSQTEGAKLRYRGGHTREYPKKSYEIQLDSGLVLHWNAESDDPSMIRNALSFQFMEQIGVPSPRTRHIWLVINGKIHGIYLEIEAVNSRFFAHRGIRYQSLLYAANDSANFELKDPGEGRRKRSLTDGYEFVEGDGRTLSRLSGFISRLNRYKGNELRELIDKHINTGLYIRWLAGAVLTGNYDGFEQNYALFEDALTLKYGILPWDYEGTWGRNCYGRPCPADLIRIQGYNGLTRRLLLFPEWKSSYANTLSKLLESEFTAERIGPIADAMQARIALAARKDTARIPTIKLFDGEPDFIRSYIEKRRQFIASELKRWLAKERDSFLPQAERATGL